MNKYIKDNMKLYNRDCMEGMADYPDNYFDIAIVDPPYGIARFSNKLCDSDRVTDSKINNWDIAPNDEYFDELFRVSKNQLIWGANNFNLPKTEYFCVWDKEQTVDNFASAEYCWVSMGLKKPSKIFKYSIHKLMAERKAENGKIHPTQKPVKLYSWILQNYSSPEHKILDTHLGSASHAIAWHYFQKGGEFVGFELDKEYFQKSLKRIELETSQISMF